MRKLIAISALMVILTVFVSAASACVGPGCPAPTGIKVPTASFPQGSFNTQSTGSLSGSVAGSSDTYAAGTCAAETLSATKVTQVGSGALVESGGLASASGSTLFNPSTAESTSSTAGLATFTGTGSAQGTGVQ